ncbi:Rid family hydrolase [Paenarthrobacter sp. NPDC089714]|uniref:Rid family hydrolase n=1 Tax=Paenarthrobacter sp. NPDC089714 TaxID=3364377 RepID=UPI00380F79E3
MANAIDLIRSAHLSSAAQYAYASTVPTGMRLIFLAGSCPLNEDGTTAGVGDYRLQADKAIENMVVALEAAGAGIKDVVATRVLVASSQQSDLVCAWNVVREAFADHDVPSTLLGVTVLGYPDQLVEIEATAAVHDKKGYEGPEGR